MADSGRRIVLATIGSLGDLHPFLALALELKRRGHRPVLAAAEMLRGKVEGEGIEFAPMRPDPRVSCRRLGVDMAESARRAQGQEDYVLRGMILPYLEDTYRDVLPLMNGADLLIANNLAFGARVAADARGVPHALLALQPTVFLSAYDPPALKPTPWLPELVARFGPGAGQAALKMMKGATSFLGSPIRRLRRKAGLPPGADHPFFENPFSGVASIGFYSPLLGDLQPDAPAGTTVTGFAFYDRDATGAGAMSRELRAFLDEGEAPIVFTLGSLVVLSPGDFFDAAVVAARRLKRRAVLMVGPEGLEAHRRLAAEDVFVTAYAPHSEVFPNAWTVVHHGGVGTTAQALRAGKPQIVVPCIADQFDNALRIERLGVGEGLDRRRLTADRLSRALARVQAPQIFARAAEVGRVVSQERGEAVAADLIETLLPSRREAA